VPGKTLREDLGSHWEKVAKTERIAGGGQIMTETKRKAKKRELWRKVNGASPVKKRSVLKKGGGVTANYDGNLKKYFRGRETFQNKKKKTKKRGINTGGGEGSIDSGGREESEEPRCWEANQKKKKHATVP